MDFLRSLSERPDLAVAGHSHTILDARVNGVPVVQASSSNRAIRVTDLPASGADRIARTAIRDVFGDSVAGASPDAVRRGIRANVSAGPATMGALHEIVPFANRLVRAQVRGRDLQRLLKNSTFQRGPDPHVSGITVTCSRARAAGDLVDRITMSDGRAINPDLLYTVIMNDYMFGDPATIRDVPFVAGELLTVRDIDALAQHLRSLPQPLVAPADARTRAVVTP